MAGSCTTNGAVLEAPMEPGSCKVAPALKRADELERADEMTLAAQSHRRKLVLQDWIDEFQPPVLVSHRLLRGGHLQTLISARSPRHQAASGVTHQRHVIGLPDGEALVMHEDCPEGWRPENGCVLLLHGICGCHAAPYMVRFHQRLNARGIRTFRLDMRGGGDSTEFCQTITHAGRSEDVLTALQFIGRIVPEGFSPIGAVGVSLGGNQLLLTAGRVGNGTHARPRVWDRVGPLLSIAPPLDLQWCSDAMQSPRLRFYNWYFIKHLLRRASSRLRQREDYQAMLRLPRPKTLREFDRTFTAPLAGFANEREYYRQSSAVSVIQDIQVPTLIVTAADDPLVPVESFRWGSEVQQETGASPVRLHVCPTGGHHGFLQRDRTSWSDSLVCEFFSQAFSTR